MFEPVNIPTGGRVVVDLLRARKLLREVVAEKGADYVYRIPIPAKISIHAREAGGCAYVEVDDEQNPVCPSCIVAHVAHRAGLSLTVLLKIEGNGAQILSNGLGRVTYYSLPLSDRRPKDHNVLQAMFGDVLAAAEVWFTYEAAQYLRSAQMQQDRGMPWGIALAVAEKFVSELHRMTSQNAHQRSQNMSLADSHGHRHETDLLVKQLLGRIRAGESLPALEPLSLVESEGETQQ